MSESVKTVISLIEVYIVLWPHEHLTGTCNSHFPLSAPWWSVWREGKKVKVTLVQALRFCTGCTAHRGSRGIALPFHDHGSRRGWGVSLTSRRLFTPGKDPVPSVQEVLWREHLLKHDVRKKNSDWTIKKYKRTTFAGLSHRGKKCMRSEGILGGEYWDDGNLDCYVAKNGRQYRCFGGVRSYDPEGCKTYPAKFCMSVLYTTWCHIHDDCIVKLTVFKITVFRNMESSLRNLLSSPDSETFI